MKSKTDGFQKIGKFVVMWEVYELSPYDEYTGDDENVVAKFKNPYKAAEYCCANNCDGVRMTLYNTCWDLTTKD